MVLGLSDRSEGINLFLSFSISRRVQDPMKLEGQDVFRGLKQLTNKNHSSHLGRMQKLEYYLQFTVLVTLTDSTETSLERIKMFLGSIFMYQINQHVS